MTHDAVILAAGGSRRLGRPKQLLTVRGETLVARVARLVGATAPDVLVVVSGAYADDISAALPGLRVTYNADWASGMASSLRLAARALAARAQPVLITVVDQPALDSAHLDALLAAYDGTRDTVTAYGAARGVPVVLRPETLARADRLRGDEGFRQLWRDHAPVLVRDDRLALDMDTEGDIAEAVRAGLLDP